MMPEREHLEFDVLFVGAGPASLAGAYHLSGLIERHNRRVAEEGRGGSSLGEVSIAVIEKGREVSSHSLSGAILDPRSLRELAPDIADLGAPLDTAVAKDFIYYLTEGAGYRVPFIPSPLNNHGNYVVSLGRLVAWLARRCEKRNINIFTESSGVELLFDGDRVSGVRTGDKGLDRNGARRANYEAGADILARVTVLGEGPRGTLTKQLLSRASLDEGCNPQVYSVGIKEIWELPDDRLQPGTVMHTLGYPLGRKIFGGGFLYMGANRLLDLGLVVGLEYEDPATDPHGLFSRWKEHPLVAGLLGGARVIGYGAKAIPEGGLFSQQRLVHDGVMIIGDSGGFLNSQRLKGIHLAIKSGMLAAEAIFEALLADDFSRPRLEKYPQAYRRSWAYKELHGVRNFHQGFQGGLISGMLHGGLQMLTRGRGLYRRYRATPGHKRMRRREGSAGSAAHFTAQDSSGLTPRAARQGDNVLTFDKLTDVYHSGVAHREDQPCHLHVLDVDICRRRCTPEYGNPCQYFCPAGVYEIAPAAGGSAPFINFSNCVHCKACDIMDPYQIIDWTPPEGGDGPAYRGM